MGSSLFIAILHHLLAFSIFGCVIAIHLFISGQMSARDARMTKSLHKIYFISLWVMLLVGLSRAVWFEKGMPYYLTNAAFHAKLTFFIVIIPLAVYTQSLVSRIVTTQSIDGWINPDRSLVKKSLMIFRAKIIVLMAIIICAVMISKGVGIIKKTPGVEAVVGAVVE